MWYLIVSIPDLCTLTYFVHVQLIHRVPHEPQLDTQCDSCTVDCTVYSHCGTCTVDTQCGSYRVDYHRVVYEECINMVTYVQ